MTDGILRSARLDTDRPPSSSLCKVTVEHALTADELVTLTMEHRRLNPSGVTQLSPAMIALWAQQAVSNAIACLRASQMGTEEDPMKVRYLFQGRPPGV